MARFLNMWFLCDVKGCEARTEQMVPLGQDHRASEFVPEGWSRPDPVLPGIVCPDHLTLIARAVKELDDAWWTPERKRESEGWPKTAVGSGPQNTPVIPRPLQMARFQQRRELLVQIFAGNFLDLSG